MLIVLTLAILIVLSIFSLILGNNFISGIANIAIDNDALVDGVSSTFEVIGQNVIFAIDTSSLIIAGIALIITITVVAGIVGINVLGSGLNPQSTKIIIIITAYIGIWSTLSILAFNLINSIEIFGSVIYISLTLTYVIGVIKKLSGSD